MEQVGHNSSLVLLCGSFVLFTSDRFEPAWDYCGHWRQWLVPPEPDSDWVFNYTVLGDDTFSGYVVK